MRVITRVLSDNYLNNVEASSTRLAESQVPGIKEYKELLSSGLRYNLNYSPVEISSRSVNNKTVNLAQMTRLCSTPASMTPPWPGSVVSRSCDMVPPTLTTAIANIRANILSILHKKRIRMGMDEAAEWVNMCLQGLEELGKVVRKHGKYSKQYM